jgi:hypothetical protein
MKPKVATRTKTTKVVARTIAKKDKNFVLFVGSENIPVLIFACGHTLSFTLFKAIPLSDSG